jgi:4-hydroxythreonine-4-phosphate dehydrogenase
VSATALPLALTMGEPAGIGGEIAFKAWDRRAELPVFFVIDDPDRLDRLAHRIGRRQKLAIIDKPGDAEAAFAESLPILANRLAAPVEPGHPDPANAAAVVQSIRRAVALVQEGAAGAVVTNPIHKSVLYQAGFNHPGHTEFLAELAGSGTRSVMMLTARDLRVVPVTIHLSLAEAIKRLSRAEIVAIGAVTAAALQRDFAIDKPRLAVAGLNPHAGESGEMGREEIDIIAPAVADLVARGIDASGPAPADTLFHDAARTRYDAVLCMYHDQALIPLKTIDFAGGVNVTLGLPFIRTSPDHGTAFDIAGTGSADESSLVAALQLAGRLVETRRAV